MTSTKIILLGVAAILALTQCKKEKEYYFGDPVYDIVTDSIYYSKTDGILKIDFQHIGEPNDLGKPTGYLLLDENPDPSIQVAIIYYSSTIPINKGMYWKIRKTNRNKYIISWTPIIYN